jgi:hypothetical protein
MRSDFKFDWSLILGPTRFMAYSLGVTDEIISWTDGCWQRHLSGFTRFTELKNGSPKHFYLLSLTHFIMKITLLLTMTIFLC